MKLPYKIEPPKNFLALDPIDAAKKLTYPLLAFAIVYSVATVGGYELREAITVSLILFLVLGLWLKAFFWWMEAFTRWKSSGLAFLVDGTVEVSGRKIPIDSVSQFAILPTQSGLASLFLITRSGENLSAGAKFAVDPTYPSLLKQIATIENKANKALSAFTNREIPPKSPVVRELESGDHNANLRNVTILMATGLILGAIIMIVSINQEINFGLFAVILAPSAAIALRRKFDPVDEALSRALEQPIEMAKIEDSPDDAPAAVRQVEPWATRKWFAGRRKSYVKLTLLSLFMASNIGGMSDDGYNFIAATIAFATIFSFGRYGIHHHAKLDAGLYDHKQN